MRAQGPRPPDPSLVELGTKILSGGAGETWSFRAQRLATLMGVLFGPGAPPLPPGQPARRPRRLPAEMVSLSGARTEAHELVPALADALFRRDLTAIASRLLEQVWLSWPDGSLDFAVRDVLLEGLRDRPGGSELDARADDVRLYSLSELKSITARGVSAALDATLDLRRALVATCRIIIDDEVWGRALFVLRPGYDGRWRSLSFPLVSVDEAAVENAGPPAADDGPSIAAENVVRHWMLGHSDHLAALESRLMRRVWLGLDLADVSEVPRQAAKGPHRMDAADRVFGKTRQVALGELNQTIGATKFRDLERRAVEAWNKPWARIPKKLVATDVGRLDPLTATIQPQQVVLSLMIEDQVRDGRGELVPTWKVGGLFGRAPASQASVGTRGAGRSRGKNGSA